MRRQTHKTGLTPGLQLTKLLMIRNKRTKLELTRIFFILLANHLITYSLLWVPISLALAGVGAGFAWLFGGSALGGTWLGVAGLLVWIFLACKESWIVLDSFRGSCAYLYELVWGGYLSN